MSILLCTTESHTFIATDPQMPSNINLRITTYMAAWGNRGPKRKKTKKAKKIKRFTCVRLTSPPGWPRTFSVSLSCRFRIDRM